MTLREMRKEFEKDFDIIFRKATYVAHSVERSLSKAEKEIGHISFYDYYSKYKNKWIYRVHITKKQTIVSFMLFYDTAKGHMAVTRTAEDYLVFHTSHFFERFNERNKLGLTIYREKVCAFMNECITYGFHPLEAVVPGVRRFFGIIPSGAILGIQHPDLYVFRINTFIANNQLGKEQKEFQKQLNIALDKYEPFEGDYL